MKIIDKEKIILITGGIGDLLQCLPYLLTGGYNGLNLIVLSHQESLKNLLSDLKINFKKFYIFENIDDQNKILNKLSSEFDVKMCPRSKYFDNSEFIKFEKNDKNSKKIIGVHLGGSRFSINIQNNLNLPSKNLPAKIICDLSMLDYDFMIFGDESELSNYNITLSSNVRIIQCERLIESFGYLSSCDLFVGSDSAFKTLSVMLKIPTMVWMGDYCDEFRDDNFINPYVNDGLMDVYRFKDLSLTSDYNSGLLKTKRFISKVINPENNRVWTALFNSDFGPMIVNSRDKGVSGDVINYGYFEIEHVNLLISLTKYLLSRQKYVTIYDVGANIGTHTLALAKTNCDRVHVRAFEPQSKVFYMLCGSIALNGLGNVHCHNYAVGNKNFEFIKINVPSYSENHNYGGFEIKKIEKSDNEHMKKPFIEDVQLMRLDSFNEIVDLLKIDVEGMEEDVLAGAISIFENSNPICFVEYFKSNSNNIFDFFRERGYIGYATHQDLLAIPSDMDLVINGMVRVF